MMHQSWYRRFTRRLDKTLASVFFIDQWVILAGLGMDYKSLEWAAFRPLLPEKDRYWGDPFIHVRGGQYYVFLEEKPYALRRAHIACLTLDAAGKLTNHQVVLEREYHLSYPFLFEHAGDLFMMPETAANRTIEVYRCTRFPDRWDLSHTLMRDLYAVDATLVEHEGRYWLFANVREPGGSSLDALHLFWARSPLSDTWTPHPHNPVVRDIGSARPAGGLFVKADRLIRPSQDSSRRYGQSLRFNRITTLSENDYAEEPVAVFSPPGGKWRATHTFNQTGGLTVIDAVLRRPK